MVATAVPPEAAGVGTVPSGPSPFLQAACSYIRQLQSRCGPVDSVEALAYEQSRRAIEQQATTLNELRARTGGLLTAASLVASFLAAQAIDRSGFDALAVIATLAFVGVLGLCMSVLWPNREAWRFRLRATPLLEDFDPSTGRTIADMQRHLATCMEAHWNDN